MGTRPHSYPWRSLATASSFALTVFLAGPRTEATPADASAEWPSAGRARIRLSVDAKGRNRSHSPASVVIDFATHLRSAGLRGRFDPASVEVYLADASATRRRARRVPHRIDRLFGTTNATLHFVVPDESCRDFAVYFDTADARRGEPQRFAGLVGDGDLFREDFQRREIAANHFDHFVDFDGDGDLDLFKGGVEPYVYSWENTGGNRLEERGRLSSRGEVLKLPSSRANRSWVSVAFFDIDGDGDQDLFPSFNDGPDSGSIVFYQNSTEEAGGELAFDRVGPLKTAGGGALAGGPQAGGWFPSIAFVRRLEGADSVRVDALVGSANRCWYYRGLGLDSEGAPRFDSPVALEAAGREIVLVNPRFDVADVDLDGDWDLFAGTQSGPVLYFRSVRSSSPPKFAAASVVAFGGRYLIGDAHSGIKVADFDGDGLDDFVAGRFWERADLDRPTAPRDFGGLWKNTGTRASPGFERQPLGAPYTERFQPCDAVRQNSVRAVDWDGDGRADLLAGDTDGFVWLFRNRAERAFSLFAPGERLLAAGQPLCLAGSGGHARLDVCDWNGDQRRDLVVADGSGAVTIFFNRGTASEPALEAGQRLKADGKDVQVAARASVLACDWDGDGRGDLVLGDEKGYSFLRNTAAGTEPVLAAPKPVLFGGKPVTYVRPNLGSFVDWDGDGKRDLIACHFENTVRFYRNLGGGPAGAEPEFADPEGVTILTASAPQMISGADAVDWNGDGDLDILTGQGHGASGLRFFERDWIEDEIHGTHPTVTVGPVEVRPDARSAGVLDGDFLAVVRRYADTMIERGRDTYGPKRSGLFLSALDRRTLAPLTVRPAAPAGIRRGDRPGRAWSAMNGANPQLDQNLLRVLYSLSEITGEARYAKAADEELSWFFANTLSPATSLLPWGEHLSWDVVLDQPISGGDEMMHEFARPWVLWERCFALEPVASRKFALGLWEHQVADHKTGGFDRHAPYLEHGPVDGKDFPRHAGFYIGTWCYAWKHTRDEVFLRAIETLVARFERKRTQKDGSLAATIGPLDCETAASMVPEPLAARLRSFAAKEDDLILPVLRKQVDAHADRARRAEGPAAPPKWTAGYSASTLASSAMFCLARWEQTKDPRWSDLVVAIADAYLGSQPEEDVDAWPMGFAHAVSTQVAAHRFTGRAEYRSQTIDFGRRAVEVFWQDRPLPRASMKTGHYETITGADSLALALLELHVLLGGLPHRVPSNTVDR
jgi:hypothetical protein